MTYDTLARAECRRQTAQYGSCGAIGDYDCYHCCATARRQLDESKSRAAVAQPATDATAGEG